MTAPYDPQYGPAQGWPNAQQGTPGPNGFGGGQPGYQNPYPGSQGAPGQPYQQPGQPSFGNQQPGHAYPGYQQPGQPYAGYPAQGPRDPNLPGFAAVNQIPGQFQAQAAYARKRGIRIIVTGVIVFVLGIVITVVSRELAQSDGGTYFISLLPITGLIRIIIGVNVLAKANRMR
jgi:hypothetical protein